MGRRPWRSSTETTRDLGVIGKRGRGVSNFVTVVLAGPKKRGRDDLCPTHWVPETGETRFRSGHFTSLETPGVLPTVPPDLPLLPRPLSGLNVFLDNQNTRDGPPDTCPTFSWTR